MRHRQDKTVTAEGYAAEYVATQREELPVVSMAHRCEGCRAKAERDSRRRILESDTNLEAERKQHKKTLRGNYGNS